MAHDGLIPVAQYVRMSTDRQQYSIANQREILSEYARAHGLKITKTYADPARSGLTLKGRPGLRALLSDVTSGKADYRAVLVYDVSRWGRFQDADESAHYEFLCKDSGIPVRYCAEEFPDRTDLTTSLLKVLKRALAAEYSRDLARKISAGHHRVAKLGFKQGSLAGFGFSRILISSEGTKRTVLHPGEIKSVGSDRVLLASGSVEDASTVRDIFSKFIHGTKITDIARQLNEAEIRNPECKKPWTYGKVRNVLTNPKYKGIYWWGKTKSQLGGPKVPVPAEEWIEMRAPAIVSPEMFTEAAEQLKRTCYGNPESAIKALRALYKKRGKLTYNQVLRSRIPGSASLLRRGLPAIYAAIGRTNDPGLVRRSAPQRAAKLKTSIVRELRNALVQVGVAIPQVGNAPQPDGITLINGKSLIVKLCRQAIRRKRVIWIRQSPRDLDCEFVLLVRTNQNFGSVVDASLVPGNIHLPLYLRPGSLDSPSIVNFRDLSNLAVMLKERLTT